MSSNQKGDANIDVKLKVPPRKSKGFNSFEKSLLSVNFVLVIGIAYLASIAYRDKVYYTDCGAYYRLGYNTNGIYEIQPTSDKNSRFNVYCDMEKGGWTVIMRRRKDIDSVIFKRALANYKAGFGSLEGNHWLGLDRIHLLTVTKKRDMMFIIDDAQYQVRDFRVQGEDKHYKLVVDSDIDQMPHDASFTKLNNTFFSAADVDFDLAANGNCTEAWDGGWWFTNCFDKSVTMTGLGLHNSQGVTKFTNSVMLIK